MPGAAEAITGRPDIDRIFWHRDQVTDSGDDSAQVKWLEDKDVTLVRGNARVVRPGVIGVGDQEIAYERLMIATGSVPIIPPIDGLSDVDYWTSREATSSHTVPASLIVVGSGPGRVRVGAVLPSVGSDVTIVAAADRLIQRDHPDASKLLTDAFEQEGYRCGSPRRSNGSSRAFVCT